MLGKLKNILGIEGVKAKLLLPVVVLKQSKVIKGKVQLESLSEQKVNGISLKLIEKYARGRKDNRLIDEYTLGEHYISGPIIIKKDEQQLVDFEFDFSLLKSEMDEIGDSNIVSKGLVKLAKYLKKVDSSFRVEASVEVAGTKLNPTVVQEVEFK
jgi:sporulation-control protein spo0M